MWVAASVRNRWAITTDRVPAAIAAVAAIAVRHHASPPRSPHQMPAPANKVTAAPMFEPVHGEPANTPVTAISTAPCARGRRWAT